MQRALREMPQGRRTYLVTVLQLLIDAVIAIIVLEKLSRWRRGVESSRMGVEIA